MILVPLGQDRSWWQPNERSALEALVPARPCQLVEPTKKPCGQAVGSPNKVPYDRQPLKYRSPFSEHQQSIEQTYILFDLCKFLVYYFWILMPVINTHPHLLAWLALPLPQK